MRPHSRKSDRRATSRRFLARDRAARPLRSRGPFLRMKSASAREPADWEEDMVRGLAVIGSRSESLSRFMASYARLAKLPQPKFQPVDIAALARRVVGLETRMNVALESPEIASFRASRVSAYSPRRPLAPRLEAPLSQNKTLLPILASA